MAEIISIGGWGVLRVGDTFIVAGVYRPYTASERAINGWRKRRNKRKLPRKLQVFTVAKTVSSDG